MGGMVGWESRGWKVLLPTVLLIGTFPCCHPCRDLHAQRRSGGASGRGLGSIQGLRLDLRHSTCVRIRGGRSKEAVIGDGPAMGECESGHAKPPSAGTGEGESSMGGNVMGDAPSAGQALPARDEFGSATQRPWGDCGPAIEMHQDEALRRFRTGGSILLVGIPKETEFGIDLRAWMIGEKFKGLKMIPAGLHLVTWGAGHGMSQCMWVKIVPGNIIVRTWDESLEDVVEMARDDAERYAQGVKNFDFDSGMAPFPDGDLKLWKDLTHFITEEVLERAGIPILGGYTSSNILPGGADDDARRDQTSRAVSPYWGHLARTVTYTPIENVRSAVNLKGLTREQVTSQLLDASSLLDTLLSRRYSNNTRFFLGEFQLAFVSFLRLSCLPSLDHWKNVIGIMTASGKAMRVRPAMFRNFLTALEFQLLKAPEEWFKDELTEDSFLRKALVHLYENIQDVEQSLQPTGGGDARLTALVDRARDFFKFIQTRFGLRVRGPKLRDAVANSMPGGQVRDGGAGGQRSQGVAGKGPARVECDGEEMDDSDEEDSNEPMVVDLDAQGLEISAAEEEGEMMWMPRGFLGTDTSQRMNADSADAPIAGDAGDAEGQDSSDSEEIEGYSEREREAQNMSDTLIWDLESESTDQEADVIERDADEELATRTKYMNIKDVSSVRPGMIGGNVELCEEGYRHEFDHDDVVQRSSQARIAAGDARNGRPGAALGSLGVAEQVPREGGGLNEKIENSIAGTPQDLGSMRDIGVHGQLQYFVKEAEDGLVLDLRGENAVIYGPRHIAESLVNVAEVESEYGKKVIFSEQDPLSSLIGPEGHFESLDHVHSHQMQAAAKAEQEPQTATVGSEQERLWAREGASMMLTRDSLAADASRHSRDRDANASTKRDTKLDYSKFEQLSLSTAEEEKEEERTIPMCKRCDLHNPAELAIRSKETGEELELICTECAEYCDAQGNPLERMPWMLEEPDWWQNSTIEAKIV